MHQYLLRVVLTASVATMKHGCSISCGDPHDRFVSRIDRCMLSDFVGVRGIGGRCDGYVMGGCYRERALPIAFGRPPPHHPHATWHRPPRG
jgi:hypothetical protein